MSDNIFYDNKKIIIVIDKEEYLINQTIDSLKCLKNDVFIKTFIDPEKLIISNIFKKADVIISGVELKDDFDGRNLYFEQKERFKLIPFLFLIDRPTIDEDYNRLSIYHRDLFDYMQRPFDSKNLKQRVNLMLSITSIYNMHMINTAEGIRSLWRDVIENDKRLLNFAKKKEKETFITPIIPIDDNIFQII